MDYIINKTSAFGLTFERTLLLVLRRYFATCRKRIVASRKSVDSLFRSKVPSSAPTIPTTAGTHEDACSPNRFASELVPLCSTKLIRGSNTREQKFCWNRLVQTRELCSGSMLHEQAPSRVHVFTTLFNRNFKVILPWNCCKKSQQKIVTYLLQMSIVSLSGDFRCWISLGRTLSSCYR